MVNRKLAACIAAILAVLFVFGACSLNGNSDVGLSGEGGLDIAPENQFNEDEAQTQSEKPNDETAKAPKYSVDENLIALTFDDGPRRSTTNRILDILERSNSVATFFVVGYNIEDNAETIKRASEMGCEMANHSDGHKKLTSCTPEEIREQVDKPNNMLKEITGVDVKLFRAPGGHFGGVEETIAMPLIQWSVDTEDWRYKDAAHKDRTADERDADIRMIADDVLSKAEKGDIILMHDIYDFTADLCEVLIPELVERGFKLVTVSEMYEAYGKELESGKVYRNIKFEVTNIPALPAGAYLVKTSGTPLNLRKSADVNSESLAKIENGTVIVVTESVPGWAYVKYESVSGWVNANYLLKF